MFGLQRIETSFSHLIARREHSILYLLLLSAATDLLELQALPSENYEPPSTAAAHAQAEQQYTALHFFNLVSRCF